MTRQLDVFGGEVDAVAAAQASAPLSPTQHAILVLARRPEGVTASQAGRVIHGARNAGAGCRPGRAGAGGVARGGIPEDGRPCCTWMSGDGSEAIKRLRERGLVRQDRPRGPWYAVVAS